MAERQIVVDHLKIGYEGLFNVSELYALISSWFFEKGWDWYEKMNLEQITPEGKQIQIVLEPWKTITDYYKITMRMKIHCINLRDVDVEKDGKTLRLTQGQVRITIDGYVISDKEGLWTKKPFWWLFAYVMENYFYSGHFGKSKRWIARDVEDIHQKIKNYLNVFKYSYRN